MKHALFIIAFGPEVRTFIHSGLIAAMQGDFRTTLFTSNPSSIVFRTLGEKTEVHPFPDETEHPFLRRLRWHANQAELLTNLNRTGIKKWQQHISPVGPWPPSDRTSQWSMIHNRFTRGIFSISEKYSGRFLGTAKSWKKHFSELDPSHIIASSYSDRTLPALQTARNLGIKTTLIFNSWKDLYTRPHVPPVLDNYVVWNYKMMEKLLSHNRHISKENIHMCFPLHFSRLIKGAQLTDREFRKRIGADDTRPLITYTAASPMAAPQEESAVSDLIWCIRDMPLAERPQIIIRLNPMETKKPRFLSLKESSPGDVILNYPQWEWDSRRDWCAALQEDTEILNCLIHYSSCNVSIPSTMSLEYAVADKPVINISYDPVKPPSEHASLKRFWEADFYREIRESGAVRQAKSRESLKELVMHALENTSEDSQKRNSLIHSELGKYSDDPVERMAGILTKL